MSLSVSFSEKHLESSYLIKVMNFPMVIKEIDLGLQTKWLKWLSVAKTTCVKLYLVLMLLDEIVLYILSRFLLEKFLCILQCQMFPLHVFKLQA